MEVISHILVALAAIFNAVMDKTKDTIQYKTSVFYKWGWNPNFFNDEQYDKWQGYLVGKYKPNAWHLSKSRMVMCLLAIPFVYKPFLGPIDYLIFGYEWIVVFNLFYDKIFKFNPKK